MLVGSHHGAINVVNFPVNPALGVSLLLDGLQDAIPDASLAPAAEAGGHRPPRSVPPGKVPPGSPSAKEPQDDVQDLPTVFRRPASLRFLRWEQGPESLPLLVV